jgi:hypothetical protein
MEMASLVPQAELDRLRAVGEELAAAIEQARDREEWGDDFEAEVLGALKAYREAVPEREEPHGGE